MTLELGREHFVLVGFSRALLAPLAAELPEGSTVVIEEPDVAAKREEGFAAESPSVNRVLLWEYQRPGAMAQLLRTEPSLRAARAVMPGNEVTVTAAADLAALLCLPGGGSGAAMIFRDKARQRQTAAAAGIRNPDYAVTADVRAAVEFLRRVGGRCVVKPRPFRAASGYGSRRLQRKSRRRCGGLPASRSGCQHRTGACPPGY